MYFKHLKVALITLAISLAVVSTAGAEAAYNKGVQSKILFKSTKDVIGQDIAYPAVNHPEVTGSEVRIPSGQETSWHTHSVPGYAYVIAGTITLEYEKGVTKQFKAGDAFAEVVNVPHNGRNNGKEEVVLVVFFTGEQGVPFTKKLDSKKAN